MFRIDIDHFRFEEGVHKFMGQGPPDHHNPPFSPPFRGSKPFGHIPPFPGSHFKPPPPMSRESFREIRDYMLLLIISEYPDGITGYQLQEKYKFPRGTLIKTLHELEEKNYLRTKEVIIDGRANKFYMLTEMGKNFLEELKLKWANLFGAMSEFNPSKGLGILLMNRIEELSSKEDAIDFFRGIRSWNKSMLQHMEERIEKLKSSKVDLDNIINEIEEMDAFNKHLIKEAVAKLIKKETIKMNNSLK